MCFIQVKTLNSMPRVVFILRGCRDDASVLEYQYDDQKGRSGMKNSGFELLFHKDNQALD